MVTITVKVDMSKLRKFASQVPFACALAATRTVQAVQEEVRRELPSRFHIRNQWTAKGIRIAKATKQDLTATVYSVDKYMVRQELGGTKVPHGRSLAIPMDVVSGDGIVPRSAWPRALSNQPGVFRQTIGGLDGLWKRLTRRTKKQKAAGHTLKLLYVFKPSVFVKPRFGFADTARRVVRERFSEIFKAAFDQAVRTAK